MIADLAGDHPDDRFQGAETLRQIRAVPTEDRRVTVVDMDLSPPAVEFDLVEPHLADWRDLGQSRSHRTDEGIFAQHTS